MPLTNQPWAADILTLAGIAARDVALAEWSLGIREPDAHGPQGADRIGRYIGEGSGPGWRYLLPYRRDGQVAWCGHFAAWCWRVAGLRPEIVSHKLQSTDRLIAWCAGAPGSEPTQRRIPLADVRAGDLLLIGGIRPSHIAIAEGPPDAGMVPTIEGNAVGAGPGGAQYEGVVRRRRRIVASSPAVYRVHVAIRPLASDMGQ